MAFEAHERARLVAEPGLGPGVIGRLEALGFDSLEKLRLHGVEQVVTRVCAEFGNRAWRNRLQPLLRVLGEGGSTAVGKG